LESDLLDTVTKWLSSLPPEAIVLVPILAFLETLAIIGLFVSGIFLLSTVGIIYAQGETSLLLLTCLAFTGAFSGDQLGYLLGRLAAPQLWKKRWVRRKLLTHKRAYKQFRTLLVRSAPLAICAGRLTPAIRSISPFIVGVSGVRPVHFFCYDLLACSIWATGLASIVYGINLF
jgi:membrane-associated protein